MLSLFRRAGFAACFMFLAVFVLAASSAQAAKVKQTNIVMTVGEMCGGCVKNITKRFDDVEGVAKVQCSIEKRTVTLIPKKDAKLGPKAIWEIMESIGKTPKKMVAPEGTFTSKPKA